MLHVMLHVLYLYVTILCCYDTYCTFSKHDLAVGEEGDTLDPKASDDAKALMMWVKSVLAKYWILLCCGAFLLVGLQNEVSVYQIGYMAIFLFILICYQVIGYVPYTCRLSNKKNHDLLFVK